MIRVFIYEFTCAASAESTDSAGAASLCTEGQAMLSAVLTDFQSIPGVDAFTIRAVRDEESSFREAARSADWSLVIAPEFHDILLDRCRWVLHEGGRLLGPSPEAVRLCSDKLELGRWWEVRGVATPHSQEFDANALADGNAWVVKPQFGAGSLETTTNRNLMRAHGELGPTVMQPLVSGIAVSVGFLIGTSKIVALPAAEQRLATDGSFRYLGGRLPLAPNLGQRAEKIARQAIDAVPGLFGYVGVDLVLGDDGRDWAIEINPRLTTSYVGLRALAETNLAEVMLRLAEGGEPQTMRWRAGTVEFSPNGSVHYFGEGPQE